jgi:hypothetical protein
MMDVFVNYININIFSIGNLSSKQNKDKTENSYSSPEIKFSSKKIVS